MIHKMSKYSFDCFKYCKHKILRLSILFFFIDYNRLSAISIDKNIKEALLLYDQEDYQAAKKIMDEHKQELKDNIPFLYYYGIIYNKLMKENILDDEANEFRKEALKAYNKVLELDNPKNSFYNYAYLNIQRMYDYFARCGCLYLDIGLNDEAYEYFQIAETIFKDKPENIKRIIIAASNLNKNKVVKQKMELYKKLINEEDDDNEDLVLSTITIKEYLNTKNYTKAKQSIKQIINNHPYNVIGISLMKEYMQKTKTKKYDDFLSEKKIINSYQNGLYLFLIGKYSESYDIFKKIYKMNDKNAKVLLIFGDLSYIKAQEMIKEYKDDLDISDKKRHKEYLKDIERINNHIQNTISIFERLNKIYPNNISVLQHLMALYKQSNKKDLYESTKQSIQLLS